MRSKTDRTQHIAQARALIRKALDPRTPVEERRTCAVAACLIVDRYGLLSRPRPGPARVVATDPGDPRRTPGSA